MARLTIHVHHEEQTQQPAIWVDLVSDEDSLPHEHEQAHRAILARLIPGLDLDDCSARGIVVEREKVAEAGGCCGGGMGVPGSGGPGGDDIDVIDL